ncbi:MAG: ABC transporter ATP-binding protein [Chloroflexota bacterium]|nr:ABC transporter ATP-binding protein [Chloroflexota bacterium]
MGAAIEILGLRYSYPDGREALHGVDLSVAEGEKVALVGPNGAGKSTLLLHLNGILAGQGLVRVAGLDVRDGDIGRVRALVGLVFQDADDQLFSTTVFEDVAFGPIHMGLPPAQVESRVRLALEQVGMSGFEKRMPHHLSIGEKKRIAIATVLSMSPAILVLDEPSSGLDPRARRGLISLLRRLPQTTIAASHDMRLVRELFPRTVVMDEGRIVADGPTHRILADSALLDRHGLEAALPDLQIAGASAGREEQSLTEVSSS